MINVCVPVLKRYDLLQGMLQSLQRGTVVPDRVHVLDNGLRDWRPDESITLSVDVYVPPRPLGVAESWNWFITHVQEERVIVNDDIVFASHSLERLVASKADLVWAEGCGFSCFVIRDSCVEKLGLFDETISPGYGYYEDEDYLQRLDGRGTRPASAVAENVDCNVLHLHSQTLKAGSPGDIADHHRKFKIAQGNYARKWGVVF